jgi:hypothetical protein
MSVDLPMPAQATTVTRFACGSAQAASRNARSSSRPETSLPVTGNRALEILFGPRGGGGLRVPVAEVAEGLFCKS